MMFRTVRRRNGKAIRIPVDDDGNVPFDQLVKHNMERTPRARAMDAKQVSKVVHSPLITPEDAASWWVAPGRSDIFGIDARRADPPDTSKNKLRRVRERPTEAPELIPLRLGGFHHYGDWFEALGDAVFLERDPWGSYWYLADARTEDGVCRVYFKIPAKYFIWENGPKYNDNFGWGHFVEEIEWVPAERWVGRPKGYALNYSVRGRRNG